MFKDSADIYKESPVRFHRILAAFLAHQAWRAGADCIVVHRADFTRMTDIEKYTNSVIGNVKKDVRRWFPYVEFTSGQSFSSFYFSRKPIGTWMKNKMGDAERVELLNRSNVRSVILEFPNETEWSADQVISEMLLVAAGLEPSFKID